MFAGEFLGAVWTREQLVGVQVLQSVVDCGVVLAKRVMRESANPVWTRRLPMVVCTVLKVLRTDIDMPTGARFSVCLALYGGEIVVRSGFFAVAFFFVFE